MYSYGSPHMAAQKQDDQLEHTFSSYVVLKTYLGWWTMGRSGERGSGISVLPARYDDDDDKCLDFRLELVNEFTKIVLGAFEPFIGHYRGLLAWIKWNCKWVFWKSLPYERSESSRNNFGKFIHQFQPERKTLIKKLERILTELYRQNLSLLFD